MTLGDIIRMEEAVKKQIAEREQAKAEGATEERAKIVAWLMREEKGYPLTEYSGFAAMIREEIEAKEHLK